MKSRWIFEYSTWKTVKGFPNRPIWITSNAESGPDDIIWTEICRDEKDLIQYQLIEMMEILLMEMDADDIHVIVNVELSFFIVIIRTTTLFLSQKDWIKIKMDL